MPNPFSRPEEVVQDSAARWRERWARLCDWLALEVAGLAAGDKLLAHYSGPGRFYHTADHVLKCLDTLDLYPAAIDDPDAVELALWYHDAVYDAKAPAGTNEAASAQLFWREFLPVAKGRVKGERVERYILATRHDATPEEPDAALIMDIDLAVLGDEPPRYRQYAADVRQEYAHVEDGAFRAGRAALLKRFLGRECIYSTLHYRKLLEDRARANIVAELDSLEGGAPA